MTDRFLDDEDEEMLTPDQLIAYLKAPEDYKRWRAAKALGVLNVQSSIPALINCLLYDKSWGVRMNSAIALGVLQAVEAVPDLIEVLERDEEEQVREEAANALGRLGDKRAIKALRLAMSDKDEDVCNAAHKALELLK